MKAHETGAYRTTACPGWEILARSGYFDSLYTTISTYKFIFLIKKIISIKSLMHQLNVYCVILHEWELYECLQRIKYK